MNLPQLFQDFALLNPNMRHHRAQNSTARVPGTKVFTRLMNHPLKDGKPSEFKMNLMAYFQDGNTLFVCLGRVIAAFQTVWPARLLIPHDKMLLCGDAVVNKLDLKVYSGKHYLICVDDADKVFIFDLSRLETGVSGHLKPHYRLSNEFPELRHIPGRPGTWSFDMNPVTGDLIIGSNSHKITYFSLGQDTNLQRKLFAEEKHNIPNVSFSPCGRYIGSCSISKHLTIYETESKTILTKFEHKDWMWTLHFQPLSEVANQFGAEMEHLPNPCLEDKYLLVCSDNNQILLLQFFQRSDQPGQLSWPSSKKIGCLALQELHSLNFYPIMQGMVDQSFRLSLSKKLGNKPMYLFGLHHTPHFCVVQVITSSRGPLLTLIAGHTNGGAILGLDWTIRSQGPNQEVVEAFFLTEDEVSVFRANWADLRVELRNTGLLFL